MKRFMDVHDGFFGVNAEELAAAITGAVSAAHEPLTATTAPRGARS